MKILVVDDFSTMRRIVRNLLVELGFSGNLIQEADDGEAAMTMLKAQPFDMVVTDWNMPNMTGIEFLKALRRERNGDKPIVVFCTTENDVAHISEALGAGANEYIMKPFDREIIQAKLAEVGLV